ncbi:PREDICTED: uncharacterized protein LOC108766375 [Trachymyrmex cornetzi]|uniref:uncharacterized protein LOC108766375 n=1 Tax=Trachymyrmex cornetzi TaxID=471704 RepID=UPI00084F81BB|nr:PREDICTED: uncharacterized protein LOC108766375 [Trachymyrmex cornetzi]XP_018371249.1 PREDICTED: uncharacterized protein LOC108766375 [Trachymyrmex cornetzi]XP_018371328.1 PREDICTED: uncharacterized protein LOC108766375 [Trachymyrmex cornetzi]XP_018371399.1 PREDICTED: uncharacterized protein LOC108766375 [Trachymyrmex cornetzi]
MKHDQEILKNDLRLLKEQFDYFLMNKMDPNETVSTHWIKANNIHWPLKTKEDYDNLNKLLCNENIRIDFVSTIGFIINTRTALSKNLLFVIRKFIHKDLATKFTCVKNVKNKFTMKPSLFYDCIVEAFFAKRRDIQEPFSEKILEKLIGAILTNSKDWGTKRRFEKTIVTLDAVTEEKEIEEDKENVDNQ